jgi:4-aminobutyrate aminotransferase-like enzyme
MSFDGNATVQGKGLAIGIELKDEDYAGKIGATCRKGGLLISAEENVLMLMPALTIDRATSERGLDILERAI